MVSTDILVRLLSHRGPVWYVKEDHVPGNDMVCPRCNGKGTCEVMKSDCRYNSWTEVVTCYDCKGKKRVSKRLTVQKCDHWDFTVTKEGIELGHFLKERDIFLSETEAQAEVEKLSRKPGTKRRQNR